MVALFFFITEVQAGVTIEPLCCEDSPTIVMDEIVVTAKKETMEGWEIKAPGAIRWSVDQVPHHIVMEIQGSDVQLAFQHTGFEVEDYCVHHRCPTLRYTKDSWLLFTHYGAGSIPFTYRVRALPNMWRIGKATVEWEWLYRSTLNEEK